MIILRLLALVSPLAMLGCNLVHPYPSTEHFVLPAPAVDAVEAARPMLVEIPRARVAAPFGSRALQYRVDESRYEPAYYAQWSADPGSLVTGAVAQALASTGAFDVLDEGSGAAAPRLLLSVTELYADVRDAGSPRAVVAIRATLLDERGVAVLTRADRSDTPASSDAPSDIINAWASGVGAILESLAPALLSVDLVRPREAIDSPEPDVSAQ